MTSFSRGLGPRLLLLVRQQASRECAATQARLVLRARFSSSPRRLQQNAAKTASKPRPAQNAPVKSTHTPAVNSAATRATFRPSSYAEQLALKGRTLLYEAPSHLWYRIGCFSSGVFCISYTVYQYWSIYLSPPDGLSWWVPHAFGIICVFMAGMGGYFIMGAGRIVRSIEAVPTASIAKLATKTPVQSPIMIEVATSRMAPFLRSKKTLLQPDEVQLPFRMYGVFGMLNHDAAAQRPLSMIERVRAERAAREARILARKHAMDHILTSPFRDAAKAFGGVWAGIVRSFNREGFAKVKLGSQLYKLDVMGGWALDSGRAIDRLLPVRPNALKD
ncbi:hypothetical protein MMYC01_209432 [Madurella mycetomatis]|uniref:Uncharacterized protein n=1 Tax=Madurella mycetomatis TaxID=100816 RepID=A0A175VRW4_9PEZI|nr:hypothetical protein MMYC01_209432 [Madurella mycetomatis]